MMISGRSLRNNRQAFYYAERGGVMEEYVEVKPIGVEYICDFCDRGKMINTGDIKMYENHATFIHRCEKCGVLKELPEKYPLIRYEGI